MKSFMPLILIAVSIALFYVYIDPRYENIKTLTEQKREYSNALNKAGELSNVSQELLSQYNSLSQADLLRLEKLIPDNLNTIKLITDIDNIAGKYSIAVSGISVRESSSDPSQQIVTDGSEKPYQTAVISFSFSATYSNLVSFLRDLERSLQIIDVKSLAFKADATNASGIYDYEVSINTYWVK